MQRARWRARAGYLEGENRSRVAQVIGYFGWAKEVFWSRSRTRSRVRVWIFGVAPQAQALASASQPAATNALRPSRPIHAPAPISLARSHAAFENPPITRPNRGTCHASLQRATTTAGDSAHLVVAVTYCQVLRTILPAACRPIQARASCLNLDPSSFPRYAHLPISPLLCT